MKAYISLVRNKTYDSQYIYQSTQYIKREAIELFLEISGSKYGCITLVNLFGVNWLVLGLGRCNCGYGLSIKCSNNRVIITLGNLKKPLVYFEFLIILKISKSFQYCLIKFHFKVFGRVLYFNSKFKMHIFRQNHPYIDHLLSALNNTYTYPSTTRTDYFLRKTIVMPLVTLRRPPIATLKPNLKLE